jgi:hypothetical protein
MKEIWGYPEVISKNEGNMGVSRGVIQKSSDVI